MATFLKTAQEIGEIVDNNYKVRYKKINIKKNLKLFKV